MRENRTKLLITTIVLGSIMLIGNSAFASLVYTSQLNSGVDVAYNAYFTNSGSDPQVDFNTSFVQPPNPPDTLLTTNSELVLLPFEFGGSQTGPNEYSFEPTLIDDGFLFYANSDRTNPLFTMDVVVESLKVGGLGANINVEGVFNLTDFKKEDYTIGTSIFIDALKDNGGVLWLTFQTSTEQMDNLLEGSGSDFNTTYSGAISTVVPIPGAVWLLGSGLFGMALIRRRKQ